MFSWERYFVYKAACYPTMPHSDFLLQADYSGDYLAVVYQTRALGCSGSDELVPSFSLEALSPTDVTVQISDVCVISSVN